MFDDVFRIYPKLDNVATYKVEVRTGPCVDGIGDPDPVCYLTIDEQETESFDGAHAVAHLNPEEALSLAIELMDWARDNIKLSSYDDYEADEAIEWPYCHTCGTTLVNGVCPEKQAFDDWDHEQRSESIGVWLDDGADDWAVDGANQEWR